MRENEVQVFNHKDFGGLKVLRINDEPWFIGRKITGILGYQNSRDALKKLVVSEVKGVANCDTLGDKQNVTIINEAELLAHKVQLYGRTQTAK